MGETLMKYMLTWTERPQGSPMEYENAQKRILEVFTQWKAPSNFKIELFVIRVGDWGGYMLLDCDDPAAVHKFCSMLPAFVFEARPVIPIEDAVRVASDQRESLHLVAVRVEAHREAGGAEARAHRAR